MEFTWLSRWQDQLHALLRIIAGLLFLEHGTAKLFAFPVPQMGVPDPLPTMLVAATTAAPRSSPIPRANWSTPKCPKTPPTAPSTFTKQKARIQRGLFSCGAAGCGGGQAWHCTTGAGCATACGGGIFQNRLPIAMISPEKPKNRPMTVASVQREISARNASRSALVAKVGKMASIRARREF